MPEQAIGIFDSGIGGLTVLHAVAQALPAEDLIYLGDTGRTPYGSKSAETITRYSIENVDFLLARVVGKGPMDRARCVEYWGAEVETCTQFSEKTNR